MSQKALFTLIANELGVKPPAYRLPPVMAPVIGFLAESWAELRGKEALISRELMRTANRQTYFNGEKASQQFGFAYTPIETVIKETVGQFLQQRQNGQ